MPFDETHQRIRLQAVLDTAVDGIILIDAAGAILTFNPACERLFGYLPNEVIGQNVKMLMPPAYSDHHDNYISNYKRTHDPKIIGIGREVFAQRKDGTVFPIYLSVGEARQEDQPIFVGIINDLTERRATEDRLRRSQRMEAIGQLTGGIAHDFNNLLAIVLGNLELLLETEDISTDVRALALEAMDASERKLVFLGYLIRQGIYNEGFSVRELPEQYWRSRGREQDAPAPGEDPSPQ